jgi:hypothetical protein
MMKSLLSGMIVTGYLVASLYFLKFWRKLSDRFFLFFALAFLTLAAQRFTLALAPWENEHDTGIYALRLAAFLLFLFAILDKNRRAKG